MTVRKYTYLKCTHYLYPFMFNIPCVAAFAYCQHLIDPPSPPLSVIVRIFQNLLVLFNHKSLSLNNKKKWLYNGLHWPYQQRENNY